MALSIASLEPEPMEKCAVAAESPSSTTLPVDHRSHSTRLKLSQAEPRRCLAFEISAVPLRYLPKIFWQAAIVSSVDIVSKPDFFQVSSEHSTMNVAMSALNW